MWNWARRGRGIRGQSVAAAVVAVACALLAGGVLLLVLLQNALTASTETVLRTKVSDVAAQIHTQDVEEAGRSIATAGAADLLVQIVDSSGRVVAASDPSLRSAPLTSTTVAPGQTTLVRVSSPPGVRTDGDEDYEVAATGATAGSGANYTVLAARSAGVTSSTVRTVALFLVAATPLLLVIVGVAVGVLVGRSLRQVERIRSQVAGIDAHRLGTRVDVPGTRDELAALATTMNAMLARIESADTAQRRFVSHASHELRSPLSTLRTGLEVSVRDDTGQSWRSMAPLLQAETVRMGRLVEDLLTLSKTDDSGFAVDREELDLDDVLTGELARLQAAGAQRITARIVPARVRGDAGRLAQVLRNVLDNADRHARSAIRVELATTGGEAVLQIDNDGDPVPPGERERVFDRFVRLDESRDRDTGGSGLGLTVARSLVRAHDGTITTGEAPDGFCRFEIRIPLL
ncbi:hypothetical protein BKD30_03070 [Tersicoccus phoenicis]|uniref:histidine kinase n=1 Tax=Tersicoccus phoenicis TaxID=554083 RepID=A0A1R1LJC2_9MICC|nr:hypothetical protein BKD30_03070 [Tersicoccus phoenicis]